jgi:hypothetical protein
VKEQLAFVCAISPVLRAMLYGPAGYYCEYSACYTEPRQQLSGKPVRFDVIPLAELKVALDAYRTGELPAFQSTPSSFGEFCCDYLPRALRMLQCAEALQMEEMGRELSRCLKWNLRDANLFVDQPETGDEGVRALGESGSGWVRCADDECCCGFVATEVTSNLSGWFTRTSGSGDYCDTILPQEIVEGFFKVRNALHRHCITASDTIHSALCLFHTISDSSAYCLISGY